MSLGWGRERTERRDLRFGEPPQSLWFPRKPVSRKPDNNVTALFERIETPGGAATHRAGTTRGGWKVEKNSSTRRVLRLSLNSGPVKCCFVWRINSPARCRQTMRSSDEHGKEGGERRRREDKTGPSRFEFASSVASSHSPIPLVRSDSQRDNNQAKYVASDSRTRLDPAPSAQRCRSCCASP